ncbi:helicase HerA-like domain-containing protein [Desertibaculum subflavum]|uniref:helicase HerA-like domain-containing protein n=1 Tax=Desertibaculum subflavum TaxID=2268458 RepID=UPI000E663530
MAAADGILIGRSPAPDSAPSVLLPKFGNRHGLIAGATGSGKTVTLQVIAEQFAARGTPVLVADIKGDFSGIAAPGTPKPHFTARAELLGLDAQDFAAPPALFWDLFGDQGHPVRTTVSEIGPLLLGRMLDLNETQTGVLTIAFKYADDQGLLLLDLKDLRAVIQHVAENAKALTKEYGNVSGASVGAIQRALLTLESQGAEHFLGEPALDLADLMRVDAQGHGTVSVLAADRLYREAPRLYATFLIWLLSELFEDLPEVGDLDHPKLVLFLDEAHLLFDDAPKLLTDKIEQVVRLIRSKGVGIWFVTQNPLDLPDSVLGQLGNRVQHVLRAFTPRDQKAVRVAAETFRPNPKLDTARVITELGVGEALVSFLDGKGTPQPVKRCLVRPPRSRVGPLTPEERRQLIATSPLGARYDNAVDRDSAYERLAGRSESERPPPAARPRAGSVPSTRAPRPSTRAGAGERLFGNLAASVGREIGRQLIRGLTGTLLKGSRR